MNLNPDVIRILCYGDSNTWGYISGTHHQRFTASARWTGVAQFILGGEYDIIEEGLNSRTVLNDDPRKGKEGRNGLQYLTPCLNSHEPLQGIVVMLGTNEFKHSYGMTPQQVSANMDIMITHIQARLLHQKPYILLVAPALIDETTVHCREGNKFLGATQKSHELPSLYEALAKKKECDFLDASTITKVGPDGLHITLGSHKSLGAAAARKILDRFRK